MVPGSLRKVCGGVGAVGGVGWWLRPVLGFSLSLAEQNVPSSAQMEQSKKVTCMRALRPCSHIVRKSQASLLVLHELPGQNQVRYLNNMFSYFQPGKHSRIG